MVKRVKRVRVDVLADRSKEARAQQKKEFANRAYRLMLAKGWRQADLVKASGLPRDSISTYMLGKTLPEKENLRAIATALGVEPKDLIPSYVEVIDEGAESPFEMKVSGKDATKTWIRVATTVSSATARKILELIQLDAEQSNGA